MAAGDRASIPAMAVTYNNRELHSADPHRLLGMARTHPT